MRIKFNSLLYIIKCGKNKKMAHKEIAKCAKCVFLLHFDFFCDLLLNRCTATWNLFVLYDKELNVMQITADGTYW